MTRNRSFELESTLRSHEQRLRRLRRSKVTYILILAAVSAFSAYIMFSIWAAKLALFCAGFILLAISVLAGNLSQIKKAEAELDTIRHLASSIKKQS